jgi:hypothetical protein
MTTQLTLYRCYWPQAYSHLKSLHVSSFRAEAFGLLMTLDVSEGLARSITSLLPFGAVVETIDLASYQELNNESIDDFLLYQTKQPVVDTDKN